MMRFLLPLLAALVLAACASNAVYEDATRLSDAGQPEAAVARLQKLVEENPRNAQYRAALLRERDRAVALRMNAGDVQMRAGRYDEAEREYQAAAALDADAVRSTVRLADVARARRHDAILREAETSLKAGRLDAAETRVREVLGDTPNHAPARDLLRRVLEAGMAADPTPRLKAPFRKPVTLEFRDAQLRTVFDMLSRTSGINFVFDRDVKQDQKITVFLRNTTLEDALELILTTHGLDRKVLNENSVLVYQNTPAKQKDYRELVVRSFYLSNADVKQAAVMVKTLTRAQDVFIDEKLNLMVMRDTPEVVRMADQLVRTLDLAEPEVMLEVEVLELARTRLQDLGVSWPGSVSLGARTTGTAAVGSQLIDGPMVFSIANPALVASMRATVGRSTLLANPRIRVKNREKARIHIGEKVPVFTSTAVANAGVAASVTYLDVGLKLDVEPQVYLNDDVAIKMGLEVSNIVREVTANAGSTVAYQIGTRNTNTVLQLRDGETQILAGLINDNDRRTSVRIPGLGDLPVLGRLFGSNNDNKEKTEIVLLITPRVVRNIVRPEGVMAELPVGTDTTPGRPALRISKTPPGSLAMAPGGGGTGAGNGTSGLRPAPDARSNPDAVFQFALSAPPSVRLNEQFPLTVTLPDVVELANGFVEIAYDPAVMQIVGGTPTEPGRVRMQVAGSGQSVQVTFVAIKETTGSQLTLSNAELIDASGFAVGVAPPPPIAVAIRK
jgi:general secretion pathway protein D